MTDLKEERAIAEKYLKEMIEADDKGDYELFIKHIEESQLKGFSKEIFGADIKQMHARNGMNVGYEYLGSLKGMPQEDSEQSVRFVWKGIYEKREAVIIIGIHKKNDTWFKHQSSVD